jgi:hypothetical protein
VPVQNDDPIARSQSVADVSPVEQRERLAEPPIGLKHHDLPIVEYAAHLI